MVNLDRVRFYYMSNKYVSDSAAIFATAMVGVLSGQDSRMRVGDVMESITDLFARGKTLDGAEPAGYEIGQWKGRFMCDDEPSHPVDGECFFAWVSTDFWDYEPNLAFFTEAEFKELFVDCCRNYVGLHPERKEEFEQALATNGMRL